MNIEEYRNFCIQKKGVTEEFPFDQRTLVFKVYGKMFALCDVETFESINLKCTPERAIELREQYEGINPGFHMNKTHWNTVAVHSDVTDNLLFELIDHSYCLVYESLPKKLRLEIEQNNSQ